jgi:tetratricopeptide (TPR) repeat protein
VLLELVEVHRMRGNLAEAQALAEESLRYSTDLDIDYLRSMTLLAKARILLEVDPKDIDKAHAILGEALAAAGKVENPELPGLILSEMGEVLVRLRRLADAREKFRAAEEKFRAVMDRLPKELRASYQEKHKDKFRKTDSFLLAQEVPAPPKAEPLPEATPTDSGGDALLQVTALSGLLASLPRLEEFLGRLLRALVGASGARLGFLLERRGDRLHPTAAAASGNGPAPSPLRSVRLSVVQDAIGSRKSTISDDFAVFPFATARGTEGVVYLEGPSAPKTPERLLAFQSFLNLVPIAYLTLQPEEGASSEAIEVQPEALQA